MIAKVIPAKAGSRSFVELVQYVTGKNRQERPPGREFDDLVRYVWQKISVVSGTTELSVREIETQGVASLRSAALEMDAVASRSRLKKLANYHLLLSWQEGEVPTADQAFKAGRDALKALKMEEHQYVMAVHRDTANVHLHIAVNRVNPRTFRAVSPYRDFIVLDRSMREIESEQGWAPDRGPTRMTRQGVVQEFKDQTHGAGGLTKPARLSSKAQDVAAFTGDQPFTEWVRVAALALKATLENGQRVRLEDVQQTLLDFKLELKIKGSGFVVVHVEDASLVAKASHIARFMSRDRLEQRFGPLANRIAAVATKKGSGADPEAATRATGFLSTEPSVNCVQIESEPERKSSTERPDGRPFSQKGDVTRRDYHSESERRLDGGDERQIAGEQLYRDFQSAEASDNAAQLRLKNQRVSERARRAAISATKAAFTTVLRQIGLPRRVANIIAAFRAALEGADLRKRILQEQMALAREPKCQGRETWRQFIMKRAKVGDEDAISVLRNLRYAKRERIAEDELVCTLCGKGERQPRFERYLSGVSPRVMETGNILYVLDIDGREAFLDRGESITFCDTSKATIGAGLELAKEKWGVSVELSGTSEYKQQALQIAVERGMRVLNDELQESQLQLIEELALPQKPVRLEFVLVRARDPYGLGNGTLLVKRLEPRTKSWLDADSPPINGNIEVGKFYVVRVFADGLREVDEEQSIRFRSSLEFEQLSGGAPKRNIDYSANGRNR